MVTVKEILKNCQERNLKLLSDFTADFWSEYKTNHEKYDKYFARLYSSFCPYFQSTNDTVEAVTDEFIESVEEFFMVNKKALEELFRVELLSDEDYSINENYDMIEDGSDNSTIGIETGSTSNTTGAQTNTNTNKVSPYDTEAFANDSENSTAFGARTDSSSYTVNEHSSGSIHALHRHGNIGVMTVTQMLNEHKSYWDAWSFYSKIFGDIAKSLLIVGRC